MKRMTDFFAKKNRNGVISIPTMVGGDGFEPSKRDATDLQSAPFGHSGTPPYLNEKRKVENGKLWLLFAVQKASLIIHFQFSTFNLKKWSW